MKHEKIKSVGSLGLSNSFSQFFRILSLCAGFGSISACGVRMLSKGLDLPSASAFAIPATTFATQLGAVTKVPGAPGTANQGSENCVAVTTDAYGNSYCVGSTTGDFAEANGGGNDAVVVKFNSSGVVQWARQLGAVTKAPGAPATANQGNESFNGVGVDSAGNVYCSGNTSGAVSEANGGANDIFFAKFNSSGVLQWVTQLGAVTKVPGAPVNANQGSDNGGRIAVDDAGNIYANASTFGAIAEANAGGTDIVVMKLNTNGVIQWATQLGAVTKAPGAPVNANQGQDYCAGIGLDASHNIYCGGYTRGAISEANGGNLDAVVIKFNSNGVIQWATQLGAVTTVPGAPANANQGFDTGASLAVDSSGNSYLGGYTNGVVTEANAGAYDAFVIKLNTSGTIQWGTQLGAVTKAAGAPATANQGNEILSGIAIDSAGNVYAGGRTTGVLSEANGGGNDAFVFKLSPNGVLQWLNQLGAVTTLPGAAATANQGDDFCQDIATDLTGNVYCAGYTSGVVKEANGGVNDIFMWKLKSDGTL